MVKQYCCWRLKNNPLGLSAVHITSFAVSQIDSIIIVSKVLSRQLESFVNNAKLMPGHSPLGATIAFYVRCWKYITVADPDLQIRADHPDPEMKRGPGLNFFFPPFGPQFGLKLSGGGPPLASPVDPSLHYANPIFIQRQT